MEITSFCRHQFGAIMAHAYENSATKIHIHVDVVAVPEVLAKQYGSDGMITLNIIDGAVQNFVVDDVGIAFSARFNKVPYALNIPFNDIQAVTWYTPDGNNISMYLHELDESLARCGFKVIGQTLPEAPVEESPAVAGEPMKERSRPVLTVVK